MGPPRTTSTARRALGAAVIGLYLGVSTAHMSSLAWLLLVPRGLRERLASPLVVGLFARYSLAFAGLRVRLLGADHLPRDFRGYLYVANHESALDIPLVGRYVPRPFVMKRSLARTPIGWGAIYAGSTTVDRSSAASRARSRVETIHTAARFASVIVFSEGTFGPADGRLAAPQLGLLRDAHAAGLAVVPLGHAGTRRALDGDRPPLRRGVEAVLVARPTVRPADFADADAFARACWSSVVEAVREARAALAPGWPYAADPGSD
ncbi:MAG: 1-acyl-sn-glycerol-3-phosphate acyltransferase [Polyangiaceae bacterium]|nr:1-acyl-sn-glycerol-3-phosphate acyltransferase [Polyangiaceae bacterium]